MSLIQALAQLIECVSSRRNSCLMQALAARSLLICSRQARGGHSILLKRQDTTRRLVTAEIRSESV